VLQQNIPRLLVSIVAVLHVEVARIVDADQPLCKFLHQEAECGCVDDQSFTTQEMSLVENTYTKVSEICRIYGNSYTVLLLIQPSSTRRLLFLRVQRLFKSPLELKKKLQKG
jgi:hypothetical protein